MNFEEQEFIKNYKIMLNEIKSKHISICTNIEAQLEMILLDYFVFSDEDRDKAHQIFFGDDAIAMTFRMKIAMVCRILREIEKVPNYDEKAIKEYELALDRVRRMRNRFAHSINPPNDEILKIQDKQLIRVFMFEKGQPVTKDYSITEIDGRYNDNVEIQNKTIEIHDYLISAKEKRFVEKVKEWQALQEKNND
jgi:hypothetical protein